MNTADNLTLRAAHLASEIYTAFAAGEAAYVPTSRNPYRGNDDREVAARAWSDLRSLYLVAGMLPYAGECAENAAIAGNDYAGFVDAVTR